MEILTEIKHQNETTGPLIWPFQQPPLFEPYWFEKINAAKCIDWMENNWTLSFYIFAVYVVLIYLGQEVMKNRKAFDLRRPLAAWNLGLALFPIFGLVRCTPELWNVLMGDNGFHRSVCVRDSHNAPGAFWAFVFTIFKVVELGDTAFIILRKKPLHFVHYCHHGAALIVCWCFYSDYEPMHRYFGFFNCVGHSILYAYLFLRTIGFNMPKYLSKIIFSTELLQMIVGIILNTYSIWVKAKGESCAHRTEVIILQMVGYCSFGLLLVFNFIKARRHSRAKLAKSS